MCAECKCAVYCSKECQVEHWKAGRHEECCKHLVNIWSTYEARKKRVGRAIRNQRIYTKPIIVYGIEKECFLRPCEPIDFLLCRTSSLDNFDNAASASMDTYYENIARLACGGTHPIFGDYTISYQLEEKVRLGYEDVISEFDHKSLRKEEILAIQSIVEALLYNQVDLTLYIFIESISGGKNLRKKLGDHIPYGTGLWSST